MHFIPRLKDGGSVTLAILYKAFHLRSKLFSCYRVVVVSYVVNVKKSNYSGIANMIDSLLTFVYTMFIDYTCPSSALLKVRSSLYYWKTLAVYRFKMIIWKTKTHGKLHYVTRLQILQN